MTDQEKMRSNERVKLRATFVNSLGVAISTAGGLGPIVSYIYGVLPSGVPFWLVFLTTAVCLSAGTGLHLIGHVVLGDLE